MKRKLRILTLAILLCTQSIISQNLLYNGDFESGENGVGFSINSSFYNNINPPYSGNTSPGNYSVTTNPQPMNTNYFISGGDHTTGTGNMLVVDGTTTGGQQRFWRAGNNGGGICNLTVGTNYTFHYWIKSVSTQVTNSSNQANIGYQIIGASNITLISGNATAPLPADGWQEVIYTFTATNNCVNIELWDTITVNDGNDFAVDDFALFGPPAPLNLEYSTINPSCVGASDGSIIGYGSGANAPYFYWITGTVSASNDSGVFTGLPAGNYSLNILEGADGEIHINNIVLSEPQDLTISSPVTICQNESTTLSVSGSNSNYLWVSNPTDNNLNTTAASQQVSPALTTTYTVSSNLGSNRNLIFNSDFSEGDKGFVTDYINYSPNNPNGIRRAYGIVSNPQSWETDFTSFADHTGNNGLMMIVDGSTQNSGNDKVWSQSVPVTPNQNYTFSYWVRTAALPSPANLEVIINGVSIGIDLAPSNALSWVHRTYTWNSGSNALANIVVFDRNTEPIGNDFALDDLSFVGPATSCVLTKSVTVTVQNQIVPTFSQVGPFCAAENISDPLPLLSENGILGHWTPIFNNAQTTTYTFIPDAGQCAQTTTQEVVIVENNITPIFSFEPYTTGCYRPIDEVPPALLPDISDNGIFGYWSSPAINYSVLGETVYTFTPLVNTCASNFSFTVNVIDVPDFIVNSDCVHEQLVLSVTLFEVVEDSHFTWYNAQNEIISTDASAIIPEKGTYRVVKEINGCSKEKTIIVSSINCKIPKGISPNDDTLNDAFDLSNLDVKRLEIFNRYGTEVYSKNNYKKEWVGKDENDHYLPDGTYFYVIDFNSGKSKTGWVYLIREH